MFLYNYHRDFSTNLLPTLDVSSMGFDSLPFHIDVRVCKLCVPFSPKVETAVSASLV